MTNLNKIKDYLLLLEYTIVEEDVSEELLIIEKEEAGIKNLILDCEDPILIIELPIFKLESANTNVYKELLEKNRDIIHGAFAITSEGMLIFRDTLQLENLDTNELEGTLNSLELLLAEYGHRIIELSK